MDDVRFLFLDFGWYLKVFFVDDDWYSWCYRWIQFFVFAVFVHVIGYSGEFVEVLK